MRILFAAGSRSGSEFSIQLITALLGGKEPEPLARVHSARESHQGDWSPAYSFFKQQEKIEDFVTVHQLEALKFEDPGVDDDAYTLLDGFPDAIVIATYRPLEKVINSHGNIKPWGMAPDTVERNWTNNLRFFEHAKSKNRLIMIPLENKDAFDVAAAFETLGCKPSPSWDTFWQAWPIVNDLVSQKKISNDASEVSFFMSREEILAKYPETEDNERRYEALL
ncbi:hypothetical protein [Pseudophaeobacter arcticus]|uniref:hypothetical protein n=1 Tax=Pseudophaeobacter arcticus TaxID=385492 RepID=UPI003A974D27